MHIQLTRGDTLVKQVTLTADWVAVDLTWAKIRFSMKKKFTDTEYIYDWFISIKDAVAWYAEINIWTDITSLWEVRWYEYSLRLRDKNDIVTTLLTDQIDIGFSLVT